MACFAIPLKNAPSFALLATLVALGACDPDPRRTGAEDGSVGTADASSNPFPDAPPVVEGTISGTVWMPANAPGMVPTGQEVPVSEALVYMTTGALAPIPQEVYCDRCVDPQGYFTKTDAKGRFSLSAVPGTYQVAIQKGQFRLDQQIVVVANQTVVLTDAQTTLPSEHDPAHGKWLPKIAVAVGAYDKVETIFGKLGVGMVDGDGRWVGSNANDNIDLYENGGEIGVKGEFGALLSDLNKMKQYHLIVMPCTRSAGVGIATSLLFTDPKIRQNIVEYVRAGGKWYVADWASEFEDVVWPEFIVFAEGHDTSIANCNAGTCKNGDGGPLYDSGHSKAVDPKLHDWLAGQIAPTGTADPPAAVDADHFLALDNWNHIASLGTVQVGVDKEGLPIMETPYAYVLGEQQKGEGPVRPLTVTFEPVGCGRVLYTTFHTVPDLHVGLEPQERVLVYLMGEIGVCKDGPVIE